MGQLNKPLNKKNSAAREELPKNLYEQIIRDNGNKNVILAIEMDKPFPFPPFVGPIERTQRNDKIFFTKLFNGSLTITKEYLIIDNSKELHTPEFDTGYLTELDYTLTLYLNNEIWTLEYFDKRRKLSTVLAFDQFLYYGGKK